jgi:D-3-phosphoglycerate dehydrogenase
MSRAIVTDFTFPDLSIEEQLLEGAGISLTGHQAKTVEVLVPVVADADLVITQFAPVQRPVIEAMRRAKVIIRYGIGVDNVDLAAAREKGIPVCNIPDYCINEVADQTLAFLLAQTRQVLPNHRLIAEGKWGLSGPLTGMRALRDQTVGVVGYGRIGRAVVERLIPFGCRVLVHDPLMVQGPVGGTAVMAVPLAELLAQSDIVTLHCPSLDSTRKMINRHSLAQMKPGSLLINVGRGDLVDPDALLESLQSGHLGGASLDVFDPEPIPAGHPIRTMPNVVLASHIASASPRAVRTLRESVARIAIAVHRGEVPPNIVNGVRR